jgi:hypothetical protein
MSFVPVERAALERLSEALAELEGARARVSSASSDLLDLSLDLEKDALARLTERGASAAQVERYEAAYHTCVEAFRGRVQAFEAALRTVTEAFSALE